MKDVVPLQLNPVCTEVIAVLALDLKPLSASGIIDVHVTGQSPVFHQLF